MGILVLHGIYCTIYEKLRQIFLYVFAKEYCLHILSQNFFRFFVLSDEFEYIYCFLLDSLIGQRLYN